MNDIDRARLTHIGGQIAQTRTDLHTHMENARKVALDALQSGAAEAEVARVLGVDRMTIRKWAGKR